MRTELEVGDIIGIDRANQHGRTIRYAIVESIRGEDVLVRNRGKKQWVSARSVSYIPTPQQIRERCAEVRKEAMEAKRAERWTGTPREPTIKEISSTCLRRR